MEREELIQFTFELRKLGATIPLDIMEKAIVICSISPAAVKESLTVEPMTAEEFVREKIRARDKISGKMDGLYLYICTGEEALRWAHEFASLKPTVAEREVGDED